MTDLSDRRYVIVVAGGLLGLERTIGLLRRRRVTVTEVAVESADGPDRATIRLRVTSSNHGQVRRQLARLLDVVAQTDTEVGFHDDAA